jgi:cell division protein FtsL
MDLDFEYPFKKTIANRPIVHEVDKVRQRELWQWVLTGLALAAILLVTAWQHSELRSYAYLTGKLQQELAKQEESNRELRLEIERLRSPKRIVAIATGSMHLVLPGRDDAVILQRVVAPPPPPSSVVAAAR